MSDSYQYKYYPKVSIESAKSVCSEVVGLLKDNVIHSFNAEAIIYRVILSSYNTQPCFTFYGQISNILQCCAISFGRSLTTLVIEKLMGAHSTAEYKEEVRVLNAKQEQSLILSTQVKMKTILNQNIEISNLKSDLDKYEHVCGSLEKINQIVKNNISSISDSDLLSYFQAACADSQNVDLVGATQEDAETVA